MNEIQNYADFLKFEDEADLANYYHYEQGFTPEEADRVVALGDSLATNQGVAGGQVNAEYRQSDVAWIPLSDESLWVYERVGLLAAKANKQMKWNFHLSAITEKLQFTVYRAEQEGHYDWHIDLGKTMTRRKISVVVQLSDPADYDGGELHLRFGRTPSVMKRSKGHVTVFPSYSLHRVTPVTGGERKSLVVWVSGDPFR